MIRVLVLSDADTIDESLLAKLSLGIYEQFELSLSASYSEKWVDERQIDVILVLPPTAGKALDANHDVRTRSIRNLLSRSPRQPVLLVSDTSQLDLIKALIKLGMDDCINLTDTSPSQLEKTIISALCRKRSREESSHLATHDQLTGLANRYLLNQHFEQTIGMARRSQAGFAVLLVDIDKFKLVNESLGYEIGDALLVQAAQRLATCVRETDVIARIGNDEFAILLQNSGSERNIANIAEKIQQVFECNFLIQGNDVLITTSIGIANFPENGQSPESLLKSAEIALNKAKEVGRNQFHFFTNDMNQNARLRLELEKSLRRALINQEFAIHLQPQICVQSQTICGAEALLRWRHPKMGYVSPQVFIPLLDELGILTGVEGWVLNQVCHFASKMVGRHTDMRFSVNISGGHFKSLNLKENIYLALQSSRLDARHLEIELTEDIMIEHVEHNSALLSELKDLGVSVALDDFGKGYSSLSYLKNFPANVLKLDKAFIDHLVEDKRDSAIVEAMIALSHKLDIKVVAEGVEQAKQMEKLKRFNCDYIQGYFFAKPMSMLHFEFFFRQFQLGQLKQGAGSEDDLLIKNTQNY